MSETIKISAKKLREAVQISMLTTSKERDSILSNALIKTKDNTITILSKNSVLKSEQTIEIQNQQEEMSLLTNPTTLFNILKELKDNEIEITQNEKTMTIKSGNFKTTIKTLNKELYPDEPQTEKELIGKIEFNKLKHLLKSTIPYPDKNDISREYTGVLIEISEGKIKATSTDHFRLINVITDTSNNLKEEKFIIENDGGTLISRIDMENEVELYKNSHSIAIKDSSTLIESKIINGEYPNYKDVLLSENESFISTDKEEFLSSLKRVSITNSDNKIQLEIKPEEKIIGISSKNQEGEESNDIIDIQEKNSNNELNINLNSRFLISFLSQIDSGQVYIYYRSSEEPIMLKYKDDEYIYNYIMTPITE